MRTIFFTAALLALGPCFAGCSGAPPAPRSGIQCADYPDLCVDPRLDHARRSMLVRDYLQHCYRRRVTVADARAHHGLDRLVMLSGPVLLPSDTDGQVLLFTLGVQPPSQARRAADNAPVRFLLILNRPAVDPSDETTSINRLLLSGALDEHRIVGWSILTITPDDPDDTALPPIPPFRRPANEGQLEDQPEGQPDAQADPDDAPQDGR